MGSNVLSSVRVKLGFCCVRCSQNRVVKTSWLIGIMELDWYFLGQHSLMMEMDSGPYDAVDGRNVSCTTEKAWVDPGAMGLIRKTVVCWGLMMLWANCLIWWGRGAGGKRDSGVLVSDDAVN